MSAPSAPSPEDKCPVDHKSREAWLKVASTASSLQPPHAIPPSDTPPSSASNPHARLLKTRPLAQDREISTIPRAPISPQTTTPNPSSTPSTTAQPQVSASSMPAPSNHEIESPADAKSGNWIYPSERMFFDAMRRKQHSPQASDMASIVPIHNAVNERAWAEIKGWEKRFSWAREANGRCGGPKLASFSGDSSKLTPRARLYSLLGYQKPFDRHDWVVERCPQGPDGWREGESVEYVIDFYQGRGGGSAGGLSFYLDVRPKLNTWEGWRMRILGLMGW